MKSRETGMGHGESTKRPHEKPDVWRSSMDLVAANCRFSAKFPGAERFESTSQLRRPAVRIPSNIVEAAARRSTAQYLRSLSIARGSLSGLDTQGQIAIRLNHAEFHAEISELTDCIFANTTASINELNKQAQV
ncbi:MAG TPA: four helix bundle protein [Rudaea sp.]|nr:four helix bundle protein [Rudaea sp.]